MDKIVITIHRPAPPPQLTTAELKQLALMEDYGENIGFVRLMKWGNKA
jgi:hypothetical protein